MELRGCMRIALPYFWVASSTISMTTNDQLSKTKTDLALPMSKHIAVTASVDLIDISKEQGKEDTSLVEAETHDDNPLAETGIHKDEELLEDETQKEAAYTNHSSIIRKEMDGVQEMDSSLVRKTQHQHRRRSTRCRRSPGCRRRRNRRRK